MMNFTEWRLLKESVGSGMNLGISRPTRIGGPIGSQFSEEEFKADDADFDEEDDDEEGDEESSDDEGLEGDLLGTSDEDEDEGPTKDFPPDDSEESDGLPAPDEEMLSDDDFEGLDGLDDLGGDPMSGDEMDDFAGEPAPAGDGMDFLNDIDPNLLGDEGGEEAPMGDAPPMDGEAPMGGEMPCPDCNPEGAEDIGEEGCATCGGEGFVADEAPMDDAGEAPVADEKDMMPSFMGKDCSYMSKDDCCSENDFLASLRNGAKNSLAVKHKDGLHEDALFTLIDPKDVFEEPKPGDVGFATASRVGSIGGGYTQDDISDIPVQESAKKKGYMTLNEYAAKRAKTSKKKKK